MEKLIGITMGCPVGIGPEIIIRFHQRGCAFDGFQPVVLGDKGVLKRSRDELGAGIEVAAWRPGNPVKEGAVNVFSLSELGRGLCWGKPDQLTGGAMARYIESAVDLLKDDILAAMVTCPITKLALNEAGYNYPGHTEMLAALCGTDSFVMMMAGSRLRVTLASIHVGLNRVVSALDPAKIEKLIIMTGRALQVDFGIENPRLAVAALNPHAGEGGMFGDEEDRLIRPAIDKAIAGGWQVEGPFPPDTIFYRASQGQFDGVVCMYHDQGLIPFKLLHFEDGVNVTLGLPIVRTSVDHGTAYDIAGLGKASSASLEAAFSLATDIVLNRKRFAEKA